MGLRPYGGGGPGGVVVGGAGLLSATVVLDQAAIRNLHNARVVAVAAVAGMSIIANHFMFDRSAGVAATDQRNSLPRFALAIASAAGGQLPTYGVESLIGSGAGVYYETVSGVISLAAYRFRVGVGNHALVVGQPLIACMNGGVVTGGPTGSLAITTYYNLI